MTTSNITALDISLMAFPSISAEVVRVADGAGRPGKAPHRNQRGLAAALWAEATAAAGSSGATGQLSPGNTLKRSAEHCGAEVCIHLQLLSLKQRQAAA